MPGSADMTLLPPVKLCLLLLFIIDCFVQSFRLNFYFYPGIWPFMYVCVPTAMHSFIETYYATYIMLNDGDTEI